MSGESRFSIENAEDRAQQVKKKEEEANELRTQQGIEKLIEVIGLEDKYQQILQAFDDGVFDDLGDNTHLNRVSVFLTPDNSDEYSVASRIYNEKDFPSLHGDSLFTKVKTKEKFRDILHDLYTLSNREDAGEIVEVSRREYTILEDGTRTEPSHTYRTTPTRKELAEEAVKEAVDAMYMIVEKHKAK